MCGRGAVDVTRAIDARRSHADAGRPAGTPLAVERSDERAVGAAATSATPSVAVGLRFAAMAPEGNER